MYVYSWEGFLNLIKLRGIIIIFRVIKICPNVFLIIYSYKIFKVEKKYYLKKMFFNYYYLITQRRVILI